LGDMNQVLGALAVCVPHVSHARVRSSPFSRPNYNGRT
jgi:hypothetical protein